MIILLLSIIIISVWNYRVLKHHLFQHSALLIVLYSFGGGQPEIASCLKSASILLKEERDELAEKG